MMANSKRGASFSIAYMLVLVPMVMMVYSNANHYYNANPIKSNFLVGGSPNLLVSACGDSSAVNMNFYPDGSSMSESNAPLSGLTVEKNDDNSQLQADSSSTNDDSNQQYYDTNFQSAIEMSGTDNGNNDLVAARNIDADYRNGAGKKKKHYSKQNSKRMGSQHHRGHANGDNVDEQISQIVELKMNVNNKECMFIHSQEGLYQYTAPKLDLAEPAAPTSAAPAATTKNGSEQQQQQAASSQAPVCGLYVLGEPDQLVEFEFEWFNISCTNGGLLSVVDGWELNGQFFPSDELTGTQRHHSESSGALKSLVEGLLLEKEAHRLGGEQAVKANLLSSVSDKYREFCGQSTPVYKRQYRTSQNVGLIQFRIPTEGSGFRVNVKLITNPKPCNVVLSQTEGTYTLRNYGRAINCSVSIMFPESFRIVASDIGAKPSAIYQQLKSSSPSHSLEHLRQSQEHSNIFNNMEHSRQEKLTYLYMLLANMLQSNETLRASLGVNDLGDYSAAATIATANAVANAVDYSNNSQSALGAQKATHTDANSIRLAPTSHNQFPMARNNYKCNSQGSNYLEMLGGDGLDVNRMNLVYSSCSDDKTSSSSENWSTKSILCGNTALRLVSSGHYDNSITIDYRLNINAERSDYICPIEYDIAKNDDSRRA